MERTVNPQHVAVMNDKKLKTAMIRIDALERANKALMARLEALEAEQTPVKRGPGRPRKDAA